MNECLDLLVDGGVDIEHVIATAPDRALWMCEVAWDAFDDATPGDFMDQLSRLSILLPSSKRVVRVLQTGENWKRLDIRQRELLVLAVECAVRKNRMVSP